MDAYVEYKNEIKFVDQARSAIIHHVRPGIKYGNVYFEAGTYSEGDYGIEAGYKVKFKNILLKGKWEGLKDDTLKHKLETEIRFTW